MKKILNLFIVVLTTTLLFGCNKTNNINANKNNTLNENTSTVESKPKEEKSYRISLFFPTEDYIVNGNDDAKFESILESFDNITNAMDSINNLKYPPVNKVDENGNKTKIEPAISESVKINSITIVDKTFIVDMKSDGLKGGSFDEDILISSIVRSLLSMEEIDNGNPKKIGENVKFTIDGKDTNTLMGHFDTSKPITFDLIK